MEPTFWRLLGDYEDLTRDQATAIAEWNHTALTLVQEKKALIFSELVQIADCLGLDLSHPELKTRWSRLVAAEKANTALMSESLAKARLEVQMLNAASQRLRAVEQVYAGEARPSVGFSALG